jgi:hypothetical protein
MKYIINEKQYKLLTENNGRILNIPFNFEMFNNDWDLFQKFLEKRGNPPCHLTGDIFFDRGSKVDTFGSVVSIDGNISLTYGSIGSLGDLTYVSGEVDLFNTKITSLGKLTRVGGYLDVSLSGLYSLGNLEYVGGSLDISETNLVSFENLKYVGENLILGNTPISSVYSQSKIRQMVNVVGGVSCSL